MKITKSIGINLTTKDVNNIIAFSKNVEDPEVHVLKNSETRNRYFGTEPPELTSHIHRIHSSQTFSKLWE